MTGELEYFQESALSFGADIQRFITGGWTFGQVGLAASYAVPNAVNIAVDQTIVKPFVEPVLHWGYEAQQNIKWVIGGIAEAAQGASEFLKTGGRFVDALTGQSGILGQIGALAPILLIGLIAFAVIKK